MMKKSTQIDVAHPLVERLRVQQVGSEYKLNCEPYIRKLYTKAFTPIPSISGFPKKITGQELSESFIESNNNIGMNRGEKILCKELGAKLRLLRLLNY
jgi:hypothetical protein